MKVLVINAGSSSLKYQLFDMSTESVLAKGNVERVGTPEAVMSHEPKGRQKVKIPVDAPNHEKALKYVLDILVDKDQGVISDLSEIRAVGHRVVHGGEKFADSVLIDDDVLKGIEECKDLAPLHNPPNIMGIKACSALMPGVPQVAVFDTAFHQTMPKEAYLYAIPYEYYEKYGVRRYGFHGTSHRYVSQRAAAVLGRRLEDLKMVTCHLGNGASVTAVDGGKSVDTSMGLTPLEGLVMGTRSGDIDPAVVTFLADKLGKDADHIVSVVLNKKSGVLGIAGISNDFRDLEEASQKEGEAARLSKLALDMFAYRLRKYIGGYAVAMGGLDAIVFTAGVGENSWEMRNRICAGLGFLGVKIDPELNHIRGKELIISSPDSRVSVVVIPTNEELMIARDTVALVNSR